MTTVTTKSFLALILLLSVILTSSCSLGGRYFMDDGTRLAHDAATGEYIGERIGECHIRDGESASERVFYKIKRRDGGIIELPAEKVKLSKP